MPRPISWLPRLPAITRRVQNSVRSHYDRNDLQALFELQPRAAQLLMDCLPKVGVGRSQLVERDALLGLLDKVQEAKDPGRVLAQARAAQSRPRRTLRGYMPRELPPARWDELDSSLELSPMRVQISFQSVEELAGALVQLASLLQEQMEEFESRYVPKSPEPAAE